MTARPKGSESAWTRTIVPGAVLGLLALCISAAEVFRATGSNFAPDSPLAQILSEAMWTTPLGGELALFGLAQLALHLAFGIGCGVLASLTRYIWPTAGVAGWKWLVLWWVLLGFWILMANAFWYPHSVLGEPYARVARLQLAGISVWMASTVLTLGAIVTIGSVSLAKAGRAMSPVPAPVRFALAATLLCGAAGAAAVWANEGRDEAALDAQHVILIGIDSLRSDVPFHGGGDTLTPNLDRFLAESAVFKDTITPLARTYPAWVSLLTGRHPHSTGAVVNLVPRAIVDATHSLPEMLRTQGYRTVYAIDEVRFSNVDESYGFDQTISPPIGAADFVLGIVNDTPLSNLVVNTWLGAWLFPHAYANRAAANTYDPDTFVVRLESELSFDGPTFFALHLALGHWPYRWRDAPTVPADESAGAALYRAAMRRVDEQFGDVLRVLTSKGALDNAIVVVFSDHGEALGEPGDAPVADPLATMRAIPTTAPPTGHGTSVFSPHQYQTLLAWRTFGRTPLGSLGGYTVGVPASLEDVTPTLADTLNLRSPHRFDGLSLRPLLRPAAPEPRSFTDRVRFTETEFNPPGFGPGKVPTPEQVREAISRYVVDPASGRLQLRPESIRDLVLRNRQYAAIRGKWLLAAVPEDEHGFRYVLVDRGPQTSATLVRPGDAAENPELAALWAALHARFEPLRATAAN